MRDTYHMAGASRDQLLMHVDVTTDVSRTMFNKWIQLYMPILHTLSDNPIFSKTLESEKRLESDL